MATQRDIARITGVSVSTVSRVLAGGGAKYASPQVQARIWEVARELDYRPNQQAQQLRRGRQQTAPGLNILTLIARPTADEGDLFFGALMRAVDTELLRQGQAASVTGTLAEFLAKGGSRSVDGVILLGRCSQESMRQLHTKVPSAPVIAVGLNPSGAGGTDQIICNGKTAAILAMEHLLAQGHTRIAYFGECSVESRYTGYYDLLAAKGLAIDRGLVVETPQTEQGGVRAVQQLLGRGCQATAIFCANDSVAIGAITALRQAGIAVPLQMAIVSIDDIELANYVTPALTTVHIPKEEMGSICVKLLLDRIDGGHSERLVVEFPARLVRRQSS